MPIYEYLCSDCRRRFSVLVGVVAQSSALECPRCRGADLTKCVSRFARLRSEDETLESLTDESAYGDIDSDPGAMRNWVRDMGSAMDDEVGGDLEEALDEELSGDADAAAGEAED